MNEEQVQMEKSTNSPSVYIAYNLDFFINHVISNNIEPKPREICHCNVKDGPTSFIKKLMIAITKNPQRRIIQP